MGGVRYARKVVTQRATKKARRATEVRYAHEGFTAEATELIRKVARRATEVIRREVARRATEVRFAHMLLYGESFVALGVSLVNLRVTNPAHWRLVTLS